VRPRDREGSLFNAIKTQALKRTDEARPKSSQPRRWKRSAVALLTAFLIVLILLPFIGNTLLNGLGRSAVERAFAKAHPGQTLEIGAMSYDWRSNCATAEELTIRSSEGAASVGRISLAGARWPKLFWSKGNIFDGLAQAKLEGSRLQLELFQQHCIIICGEFSGSAAGGDFAINDFEFKPSLGGEVFLMTNAFRTTRYHLAVPRCRVSGLAYRELLVGKSFHAQDIEIAGVNFDAVVDRDKPPEPLRKSPLMVHEALAAMRQTLQIDRLAIREGTITYRERRAPAIEPGVLTFGQVDAVITGLANRKSASDAIHLEAQARFMNSGQLRLALVVPTAPPDFSLHYSGSLRDMDLTRLGAFLDVAERVRIKSGEAEEVTFDIDVTGGHARGRVRAAYRDLEIALLDKETGTEKGIDNRIASFLANALKIRNANPASLTGAEKVGVVDYRRKFDDQFQQYLWFALRSGVLDVIGR